jgi:hypothetical protein
MNKMENYWPWANEISRDDFATRFGVAWENALANVFIPEDTKFGLMTPPQTGKLVTFDDDEDEDINPRMLPWARMPMMYSKEWGSLVVWVVQRGRGEWYIWQEN